MMIKVTPFSICTYIFHCPINTVRIQISNSVDRRYIYPDISCDQYDLIAVGSLGQYAVKWLAGDSFVCVLRFFFVFHVVFFAFTCG